MLLPVIFRRKSRYRSTGYTRNFATSGNRRSLMPQRMGCGCASMMVPVAIALITAVAWLAWYLIPLSQQELKGSDARILTETRYILMKDSTELFAFTATKGDTLLNGVGSLQQQSIFHTDTLDAQWVKRWKYLPYGGGTLAVESFDAEKICQLPGDKIAALLQRENDNIASFLTVAAEQQKDIDYFLRTHVVTDDGFDIVARYGKTLQTEVDSVKKAAILIYNILKDKAAHPHLTVKVDRRYFLLTDSARYICDTIGTELMPAMGNIQPSLTLIQCREAMDTIPWYHRRPSAQQSHILLKERLLAKPKVRTSFIDSLGTYHGLRNTKAIPHGYGRFQSYKGDFYEGEWQNGKRNGVGFSIVPGKRLQLGEWKDDAFLGERIAYTPERIYGIDISRHQHEKGKKRYSIDWTDLRITSLGHISKKKIHGEVNYPVRFVIIKATEGVTVRNKYFPADYAASRKHGYKTGVYHFFSTKTPGRKQAQNFLKYARYSPGDLPPVLDIEPTDGEIRRAGGIYKIFSNVREWIQAVEKAYHVKPILYISQRFVNKYLPLAPDLMKGYDVWIARYGEYKPDVNLIYWQLSPDGRVKGIHGEVDINVLNGFSL